MPHPVQDELHGGRVVPGRHREGGELEHALMREARCGGGW